MKRTFLLVFLISCSTYFCLATYAQQGQQENQNKSALPLPSLPKIDLGKMGINPDVLPRLRLIGKPCYGEYVFRGNASYEIIKQEPKLGIKTKDYPTDIEPKGNVGTSSPEGLRTEYRIIFNEIKYDVTVNVRHLIRRISTDDPKFKTPEGIAVGDSPEKVLKFSKSKPANVKPCLYYIELKSGWRALFPQGEVTKDGTLVPEAKVVAFFKEH
jgi:hypothetical protein